MALFTWENRFLTGVAEIDEHHQHLVELLNKTYQDFIGQTSRDTLNKLFYDLIDYATFHFSAEEKIMQEKDFPGIALHKEEHLKFTGRVAEMHKYYLDNKPVFLEMLTFLKNWLEMHIIQSDGELGRFLAKNNI